MMGTTRLLVSGATVLALTATPASAQTAATTLSGETLAIACGPRATFKAPETGLTIGGSLAGSKGVYAPWHRIVVNAGSQEGVRAGQEYFVRRVIPPREAPKKGERAVHAVTTAGWIRIDEAQERRSIASVIHECDGITAGDYLEPFAVPAVPTPLPEGTPDFSEPGRVLFGAERQAIGGSGSLLVIDRGSEQDVRPGQRFTIFRASGAGPNVIIAGATAVAVEPETTMIRIHDMRDAVQTGDSVAPHR